MSQAAFNFASQPKGADRGLTGRRRAATQMARQAKTSTEKLVPC